MTVHIPSPLFSYTGRAAQVNARGASLADVLADLDRRFPGIRFRVIDEQDGIRPHIRFFVNGQIVRTIAHRLQPTDEVHIIAALSGGSCSGRHA